MNMYFNINKCNKDTEVYQSGRIGVVLKTVCLQGHRGSSPFTSANYIFLFRFGIEIGLLLSPTPVHCGVLLKVSVAEPEEVGVSPR